LRKNRLFLLAFLNLRIVQSQQTLLGAREVAISVFSLVP
jgi:hypothetical protein